jgi:intracellular sulfur oxidation DsrE/DsrF family protein
MPGKFTTLTFASTIGLASALLATGAAAQDANAPVIQGYGALRVQHDVANHPDPALRYRVAFEVTRAADDASKVNPAFDRIARFVNLLGASGIRPAPGDVVIVIHGPAANAILNDAGYQTRFHLANPNDDLIRKLIAAGVAVHVCDYALAGQKIERNEVTNGVVADEAAMITLATLQLRGWAVITG